MELLWSSSFDTWKKRKEVDNYLQKLIMNKGCDIQLMAMRMP
jgi:hypothetical protein